MATAAATVAATGFDLIFKGIDQALNADENKKQKKTIMEDYEIKKEALDRNYKEQQETENSLLKRTLAEQSARFGANQIEIDSESSSAVLSNIKEESAKRQYSNQQDYEASSKNLTRDLDNTLSKNLMSKRRNLISGVGSTVTTVSSAMPKTTKSTTTIISGGTNG